MHRQQHFGKCMMVDFKSVTAYAAYFGSVKVRPGFKKCATNFLKDAKSATLQLRSPPAEETNDRILKEMSDVEKYMRIIYLIQKINITPLEFFKSLLCFLQSLHPFGIKPENLAGL